MIHTAVFIVDGACREQPFSTLDEALEFLAVGEHNDTLTALRVLDKDRRTVLQGELLDAHLLPRIARLLKPGQ